MNSPIRGAIAGEQYKHAREDHRHFDRLIWATPTVVVTITGVILGLSYNYLMGERDLLIIRACLLGVLAVWVFTLLIALAKFRLNLIGRTRFFHQIETDSLLTVTPMKTSDLEPSGWFQRRTAYNWLFASVVLTLLLVFGAFAHTLWEICHFVRNLAS